MLVETGASTKSKDKITSGERKSLNLTDERCFLMFNSIHHDEPAQRGRQRWL